MLGTHSLLQPNSSCHCCLLLSRFKHFKSPNILENNIEEIIYNTGKRLLILKLDNNMIIKKARLILGGVVNP